MQAIVCDKFGSSPKAGISNLRKTVESIPNPNENQILVKIHVAGINFMDILAVQVCIINYLANFEKRSTILI